MANDASGTKIPAIMVVNINGSTFAHLTQGFKVGYKIPARFFWFVKEESKRNFNF
jgi:hypothetical protein